MNIHYPVSERANRPMLWLLAVALTLASLLVAYQAISQPVLVKLAQPAIVSGSQAIPQPLPVPEPPHSQLASYPRMSATPVPPGAQLHPVPESIPTPPSGQ